jgi:hypothetical protein
MLAAIYDWKFIYFEIGFLAFCVPTFPRSISFDVSIALRANDSNRAFTQNEEKTTEGNSDGDDICNKRVHQALQHEHERNKYNQDKHQV